MNFHGGKERLTDFYGMMTHNKLSILLMLVSILSLFIIFFNYSVIFRELRDDATTHIGNIQEISGHQHAKKIFIVEDEKVLSATLQFFAYEYKGNSYPLSISINNKTIYIYSGRYNQGNYYWHEEKIPYGYLKKGVNEIIFSITNPNNPQAPNTPANSWAISVSSDFINMSARSIDGGRSWNFGSVGYENQYPGEYLVRLRYSATAPFYKIDSPDDLMQIAIFIWYLISILCFYSALRLSNTPPKISFLFAILLLSIVSIMWLLIFWRTNYFILVINLITLSQYFYAKNRNSSKRKITENRDLDWTFIKGLFLFMGEALALALFCYLQDTPGYISSALLPMKLSIVLGNSFQKYLVFSIALLIGLTSFAGTLSFIGRRDNILSLLYPLTKCLLPLYFLYLISITFFVEIAPFYFVVLFIMVNSIALSNLIFVISGGKLSLNFTSKREYLLLGILIFLYITYFSSLTLRKYYSVNYGFTDGILFFNSIINTIKGKFMYCSYFGYNFLGEHLCLFLTLLLPIFWFFPHFETALILQALSISLGAIPLFLITQKATKNSLLSISIATAYLIYPANHVINLNYNGFHPDVSFISLFFLFCVYFLLKNKEVIAIVFFLLILSLREDAGLVYGIPLGIFCFLNKKYKYGLIISVLGLIVLWNAIEIAHYIRPGGYYHFWLYSHLGKDPWEIMSNLFIKPKEYLALLLNMDRLKYLLRLVVPLGFLPIFNIKILGLATLPLMELFLTKPGTTHSEFVSYHIGLVLPFFPLAAALGVKKFSSCAKTLLDRISGKEIPKSKISYWIAIYIVLCSFFSSYYFSLAPFAKSTETEGNKIYQDTLRTLEHSRRAWGFAEKIPDNSTVAASARMIGGTITEKQHHKPFNLSNNHSEYLLLDILETNDLLSHNLIHSPIELAESLYRQGYRVIEADGCLSLLRREKSGTRGRHYFILDKEPKKINRVGYRLDNNIELVGYSTKTIKPDLCLIETYWKCLNNVDKDLRIIIRLQKDNINWVYEHIPVYGLYPTKLWQPGEIIKDEIKIPLLIIQEYSRGAVIEISLRDKAGELGKVRISG